MSQLQIDIKGQQLMLSLNEQQVSLSREDARILHEQLEFFLLKSENKEEYGLQETELQVQLALARGVVDQDKMDKLIELLLMAAQENRITTAWEHGVSVWGENELLELLSCCWKVDEQGWGYLNNAVPQHCIASALSLTAWAPEGHVLDLLWKTGAFDALLIEVGATLTPEEMPIPIFGRTIRIVTQEQPVRAGAFWMGSNAAEAWPFEQPQHLVKLTKPFAVMLFPVTQLLYRSVVPQNPSWFKGATRPVETISWKDALIFCNALSVQQGYQPVYEQLDSDIPSWNQQADGYRLPTEAEWEFVALSAAEFRFSGGQEADSLAWYAANSHGRTHGVGQKYPNPLGIYDMSGNVWEWCWDGYSADFYAKKESGLDPTGEQDARERVCRGGGFSSEEESLRIKIRGRFPVEHRWEGLGFRLVRTLFLD